jgi:hypothetical protein
MSPAIVSVLFAAALGGVPYAWGGHNSIGPIRQVVRGEDKIQRRYLVIVAGTAGHHGPPVQVQKK